MHLLGQARVLLRIADQSLSVLTLNGLRIYYGSIRPVQTDYCFPQSVSPGNKSFQSGNDMKQSALQRFDRIQTAESTSDNDNPMSR
jgi:hypothetical protein